MSLPSACCPRCHAGYSPGAAACPRCNRLLEAVTAEPPDLDGLPDLERHGPQPDPPGFSLCVEGEEPVKCHGVATRVIAIAAAPLLIGRRDPLTGSYPDIDLQDRKDFGYTA